MWMFILMNGDNQVMTIGDGENNVEMIELPSLGISLNKHSEKIKFVANIIGSNNDEYGFDDVI